VGGGALPIRPDGVNPAFILDGSSGQADKLGFYPFSANPQQENPARLHRLGQLPATGGGADARLLQPGRPRPPAGSPLSNPDVKWDTQNSQALQLDTTTDYGPRTLAPLLAPAQRGPGDEEKELVEQLAAWRGDYPLDSTSATLFNQFLYELAARCMTSWAIPGSRS
jgi:penicillin amidase